jgi:hypothetical protein
LKHARFRRKYNGPYPGGYKTLKCLLVLAIIRKHDEQAAKKSSLPNWTRADLSRECGLSLRRQRDILRKLEEEGHLRPAEGTPYQVTVQGLNHLYAQVERKTHHFDGELKPVEVIVEVIPDKAPINPYRTPIDKVIEIIEMAMRHGRLLRGLGATGSRVALAVAMRPPSVIEKALIRVETMRQNFDTGRSDKELLNAAGYALRMIFSDLPASEQLRLYLAKIATDLLPSTKEALFDSCAWMRDPIRAARLLVERLGASSTPEDAFKAYQELSGTHACFHRREERNNL